jgi:hypothetical protein
VTDHLHERLLCIPLYYDLSDDRIDGIAGIIRRSLASTHHYAVCGSPGPQSGHREMRYRKNGMAAAQGT